MKGSQEALRVEEASSVQGAPGILHSCPHLTTLPHLPHPRSHQPSPTTAQAATFPSGMLALAPSISPLSHMSSRPCVPTPNPRPTPAGPCFSHHP